MKITEVLRMSRFLAARTCDMTFFLLFASPWHWFAFSDVTYSKPSKRTFQIRPLTLLAFQMSSRYHHPPLRLGHAGGGSSREGGGDDDAEDDEVDDDDDDEHEGGTSLMDMLNANEAAEEAASQGHPVNTIKRKSKGKGKGAATVTGGASAGSGARKQGGSTAPASEASDDDSDEQIGGGESGVESDDAMDQEDSQAESDASSGDYDEDEGDDDDERHARLMGFVGSMGEKAEAASRAAEDRRSSQLLKEGEFNASSVANGGVAGGGGAARKGVVTMEVRGATVVTRVRFCSVRVNSVQIGLFQCGW